MMTQEYLDILREIKDVAFATVDEKGMPQIRIIDVMLVEDGRLYFCTARGKAFYHQLMQSGNVAITGMNGKYQMVRLNGKAEKVPDSQKWMDRIFQENPSMNAVYPGQSRYVLEPFCISQGTGEFFDLGVSPIYRKNFVLGNAENASQGFYIADSCIGCEKCRKVCPQHCIVQGKPYEIKQEHCLHCGLCWENCPTGSILKGAPL